MKKSLVCYTFFKNWNWSKEFCVWLHDRWKDDNLSNISSMRWAVFVCWVFRGYCLFMCCGTLLKNSHKYAAANGDPNKERKKADSFRLNPSLLPYTHTTHATHTIHTPHTPHTHTHTHHTHHTHTTHTQSGGVVGPGSATSRGSSLLPRLKHKSHKPHYL